MEYPPELLKPFADRLATLAGSQDGAKTLRLLRLSGLLGRQAPPEDVEHRARAQEPGVAAPRDRVGIWERRRDNGDNAFVRRDDLFAEYHHWSSLSRIEPKGHKARVVLIGESVARGYLYDPQFNPAMALTHMLQSQLGPEGVEVLDLARTNLGFEVRELAISALLLEPDAVVIFSGNNWGVAAVHQPVDIPHIDGAMQEDGIPGLKRLIEDRLASQVRTLVRDVASAYGTRGIPLVWMIPEFNLGDWRDPATNAPYLPDGANAEWIALRQRAEDALEAGDVDTAAELAGQMVVLDRGTTASGFYVLAECSRRSGAIDAARRFLEQARDASIWQISLSPPRAYSTTQNTLREEAPKHANAIVDLPELFKEHLNGGIPGRRLFLDYCHLSAEGIQVAMAATASRVLQALEGIDVPWNVLVDECSMPARDVEGEASFLAAVHNAHFWQPYELVSHHCARAVQSSRRLVPVMRSFLDLQVRRAPMLMCRSAEEIAGAGSPAIQSYLLGLNNQQLDRVLLEAIVGALNTVNIDCAGQLAQLRRDEHSVDRHDTNLLDYYYCSAALQAKEIIWVVPRDGVFAYRLSDYYKAYWIDSRFVFVGEACHGVHLRLTCRLSSTATSDGTVTIAVNGTSVGATAIGRAWETWDITVAGDVVRDGVNDVVIHWPRPAFPGLKPLETVADDLMQRFAPEFFYVFGEIHAFVATAWQEAPPRVRMPDEAVHAVRAHRDPSPDERFAPASVTDRAS